MLSAAINFFKNIKIWPLSPQVAQEEGTREFQYA
jgi:hypothetical protein